MNSSSFRIDHEWNFGDDKALADKLRDLVLSGKKTATTGLWYEGKVLTPVGGYEAIVGSDDKRFCIIQITKIEVKPFLEVGWDFAKKEGEDDPDLESWRKGHQKIFRQWTNTFIDQSLVVCEEFKVVQQ